MRSTLLAAAIVLSLAPSALAAQTGSDLNASIRAAVAADPRTASMSPAQMDAMVQALTAQAQSQGMKAQDIAWRPTPTQGGQALVAPQCSGFPSYFCTMSAAFGFTGPDYIIALWLGISALLLIFLIGALLEYRHFRHLHPKNTGAVS